MKKQALIPRILFHSNRTNKQIISLFLICVLLFSCTFPQALAAVSSIADGLITVACFSNAVEDESVEIYVKNQAAYIKASDAARFSGYSISEKNDTSVSFTRGNDKVSMSIGCIIDNECWMPLEWAMQCLHTQVTVFDSALVFVSYGYTIDALFALTDQYASDFSQYKLLDEDTLLKFSGFVASLYNRLTSFAFIESLTGAYNEQLYEKIFRDILDVEISEHSSALLSANKEIRYVRSLAKKFGEDLGTLSDLFEMFCISTDPLGSLIKELSTVSVKGLSIPDQLELYENLKGVYLSAGYARNLIQYTYSEDVLGYQWKNYLPISASAVVENLNDIWDDLDYVDILNEEYDAIIKSTTYGIINDSLGGNWTAFSAKLTGKLLDKVIMPQTGKAIDFVEKYNYLGELQKNLPQLYSIYRQSNETAVNAKYTTILNLRIIQLAYELSVKEGGIDDIYGLSQQIDDAIAALLAIRDHTLTVETINNEHLDLTLLVKRVDNTQSSSEYATLYAAYNQLCSENPTWYTNFAICDIDLDQDPEILASGSCDHMGWSCDIYELHGDELEYYITLSIPLGDSLVLRKMNNGAINWYQITNDGWQGYMTYSIDCIELLSDGRCITTNVSQKEWQWDDDPPVYSFSANGAPVSEAEYSSIMSDYESSIILQTINLAKFEFSGDWDKALSDYLASQ